ncbi:hypothetical protein ACSTIG_23495, partial [Vibrio parahaemolyticus]
MALVLVSQSCGGVTAPKFDISTLVTGADIGSALVADDKNLYWTTSGIAAVETAPLTGGPFTTLYSTGQPGW